MLDNISGHPLDHNIRKTERENTDYLNPYNINMQLYTAQDYQWSVGNHKRHRLVDLYLQVW